MVDEDSEHSKYFAVGARGNGECREYRRDGQATASMKLKYFRQACYHPCFDFKGRVP